jgi:CheY-like chemotaxis protein
MSKSQKRKEAYSLKSFRVLIVEDYPFMAELMSSMAREFGVGQLLLAENGKEAKEMVMMFNADPGSKNQIDMVITDWLMPGGDGADLVKWIRDSKKDAIRFLPIILCSAYTSEDVVFVGRDKGANEVLVKPLSAKKLADRILHVIDHPRPFIETPNFFGPDRRRRSEAFKGEERRQGDLHGDNPDIEEFHERI